MNACVMYILTSFSTMETFMVYNIIYDNFSHF